MTPRRLVVMRHAKAESTAASDFERALAPTGTAAAREAGAWLAAQGVRPDAVLVSAALRTRETWAAVRDSAGWSVEADETHALYTASPESALDLVRQQPSEVRELLLVGHNPTVAMLANLLEDGEGDDDATSALTLEGYPPGTLTVFDVEGGWSDLRFSTATLRAHHVGGR
ncbi:MAG: SixA phosphatase family protein [Nocardioides sp.]|uniref:SixA phosphatase family protein n=1 Tax=Nocardioides sp. TaxID=35761 RepID=UPI003F0D31C2